LGILVGYNDNSYRVLLNGRIINARHVTVVEEGTELICLERVDDEKDRDHDQISEGMNEPEMNDNDNIGRVNDVEINGEPSREKNENRSQIQIEPVINNDPELRRSSRQKTPVVPYGNPVSHFIYVNYCNANVPNTFEEAINSDDCEKWKRAMDDEMKSLIKNKTYDIVENRRIRK